jgi:hypothetical protein
LLAQGQGEKKDHAILTTTRPENDIKPQHHHIR